MINRNGVLPGKVLARAYKKGTNRCSVSQHIYLTELIEQDGEILIQRIFEAFHLFRTHTIPQNLLLALLEQVRLQVFRDFVNGFQPFRAAVLMFILLKKKQKKKRNEWNVLRSPFGVPVAHSQEFSSCRGRPSISRP